MKILVLSDIHYPFTDTDAVKTAIKTEHPDKLILLGDTIENARDKKKFFNLIPKSLKKNTYYIIGDEDKVRAKYEILKLKIGKEKFVFVHGHQFNIGSDRTTAYIAFAFKVFRKDLPLFAFSKRAREKLRLTDEYLVLGHTHGLKYFKSIRTVCSGTMSSLKGVYNDRGYVVIDNGRIELRRL